MPKEKPPVNEIGVGFPGVGPWSSIFDDQEISPKLAWPARNSIFREMRKHAQIAALEKSTILPILSRRWRLDRNDCSDIVLNHFVEDLGIPVKGEDDGPKRRAKGRFRLRNHLRQALTARDYGHMYFEQQVELGGDGLYHLKKLAPRWQNSIVEIKTADDGGLEYIRQFAGKAVGTSSLWGTYGTGTAEPIPVDRLVAYINDQEGDWFGNSTLRPLYPHYLRKDKLLRVDAIKHERNGMGIPIVEAPTNATRQQLIDAAQLTQQYKAGEGSGGTLPAGFKLRLVGVEGSIPDIIASLRYDDEQMARVYMAQLTQLGQTATGSRALGDSFADLFALGQDAIAEELCNVINEHVIEDIVDWNWGPDEPAPLLVWDDTEDKDLAVTDLVALINGGALTVDEELEDYIRSDYSLPELSQEAKDRKEEQRENVPVPTKQDDEAADEPPSNLASGGLVKAGTAVVDERDRICALPVDVNKAASRIIQQVNNETPKRRELNEHEKAAQTDFDAMELAFESAVQGVVSQWKTQVKAPQIAALVEQIEASGMDLNLLAEISAPVLGAELLTSELVRTAAIAASQAVAEAAAQGVAITAPGPEVFADDLAARSEAMAKVMAKSISETAARRAVTQAGPNTVASELAGSVGEHLNGLTDTYLTENLGGAVHTAQNDARFETLDQEPGTYYASELLDRVTCSACRKVNDKNYATLAEARKDYVNGYFSDCAGDGNCRGTLVKIFADEAKPGVNDVTQ